MAVFDPEAFRKEFPMCQQTMNGYPLIYLDNAASTLKPQRVIDTVTNYYAHEYATIHRAAYELSTAVSERYSNVRRQVAEFINAPSEEEIIFTRGTTESLNLVAQCYGRHFLHSGDEIILTELEHHANIVPWQILADEIGCTIKVAPINDQGELDLKAFKALLSSKTKLCAVSHASNVLGTVSPVREICQLVHDAGGICVVDGAQAIPHLDVDVQNLDCDFYAFSGHKLFGPTGVGALYGKKKLLEKMPPYQGGGDMVREVSFIKTTYQDPPFKFEAGTPMVAQVLGLGTVLTFLKSIHRPTYYQYERHLLKQAVEMLRTIPGLTIYGTAEEKVPLVSFLIDRVHPLDLGTMIGLKGVAMRTGTLCAQPTLNHFGLRSICRISFAPYNTEKEIISLLHFLEEMTALLA